MRRAGSANPRELKPVRAKIRAIPRLLDRLVMPIEPEPATAHGYEVGRPNYTSGEKTRRSLFAESVLTHMGAWRNEVGGSEPATDI